MAPVKPLLFVIIGQTATGKNAVARLITPSLQSEIISVDSMKIYRGLDIGTAKPSSSEQKKNHYHFIDIRSPSESYNVANFVEDCDRVVENIDRRKKRPLLVVGTPLYLKRLFKGIFEVNPVDAKLRRELESLADEKGSAFLYERLKKSDPVRAAQLHPNDRRRIIRALEVQTLTGQPMSRLQTQDSESERRYPTKIVGLRREREDLYQRIDQRVERMFDSGLVSEVKTVLAQDSFGKQAAQAVGYKEVIQHLNGELSLVEAKELVKRNTRRLARRQMTWFRSFPDIHWVDLKPDEPPAETMIRVRSIFQG